MAAKVKVTLIALHPIALLSGRVERGASFEVLESQAELYINSGKAEKGMAVSSSSSTATVVPESLEWKKKLSPEEYVEKYPAGPAAELARQIIAAKAATATETSSEADKTDESEQSPPTE